MKLPNAVSLILLTASTALVEYFAPTTPWLAMIVPVLAAVAKMIQVAVTEPTVIADPDGATSRGVMMTAKKPGGLQRFMVD